MTAVEASSVRPPRALVLARRWLLGLLCGALLVLVATGTSLAFEYRPQPSGMVATDLHVVAAWSSIVFAVAYVAVVLAATRQVSLRRRIGLAAMGVSLVGALGVAVVTGERLHWDQVALFAVTVANEVRGMWLPESVVAVLVGSDEHTLDEFRRMVVVHVAAIPVAVAVLGLLVLASKRANAHTVLGDDTDGEGSSAGVATVAEAT